MHHVSIPNLHTALNTQRTALKLSWRDVARATGLSSSTFSRMKQVDGIDVDGYAACCDWLGVSMDTFRTAPAPNPTAHAGLSTELVALLRRHNVPPVYWGALTEHITHLAGPVTETIHRCPPGDSGYTPCCARTPSELPRTDRITEDPALVTCRVDQILRRNESIT